MTSMKGLSSTRVRYAVTVVIDVYYVGLVPAGASHSAPMTSAILGDVSGAVRQHFLGHLARAVAEFKRRNVERVELVFAGLASEATRPTADSTAPAASDQHDGG